MVQIYIRLFLDVWRIVTCITFGTFLACKTKETTSKYLHDEVNQQNHSTLLHFKKQGNTKNNRLNFLRVKKEFYAGLCIFQPHTPYSMLLARFKIWRRTQTPRGGLPRKNDGSARRKFSENTLKGTRITPDGRGFQTFLPLRGTNLKQHKNRHFDHFFSPSNTFSSSWFL